MMRGHPARAMRRLDGPRLSERARRAGTWIALAALLLACSFATARVEAADRVEFAPTPSWVLPVQPDQVALGAAESAGGEADLLFDQEVRCRGGRTERYLRSVRAITDQSGLQSNSQITVSFDPSYQTLVLHSVTVRRGGVLLERLDRDALRVAQREPDLERQVFDGRLSAVLFVRDLRVGDILDYAYTLRGGDPTLGGRIEASFLLAGTHPIAHLRARLVVPAATLLTFDPHGDQQGTADGPERRALGPEEEFLWEVTSPRKRTIEPSMPSWHSPLPWVRVTEFRSWEQVSEWGRELFRIREGDAAPLNAWADEARRGASRRDELLLRATRFVQDEIRYVGLEVGMGRRRPAEANVVLARRYGDCKDKAALLVALLARVGIEAYPALVSTDERSHLDDHAPSPSVFDHAIVNVPQSDGADLWIDPTATLEGGDISRYRYSQWERALVLRPRRQALDVLIVPPSAEASPTIRDTFGVERPDAQEVTTLDSTRVYTGAYADAMRRSLRSESDEATVKYFVRLYQHDFPSVRHMGPIERTDDRERNVLTVNLHFQIPDFWATSPAGPWTHRSEFSVNALDLYTDTPAIDRTNPWALPFPSHTRYEAAFELPFDLASPPEKRQFESSAVRFRYASKVEGRRLTYSYDVATTRDALLPDQVADHVKTLSSVRPLLSRALTFREPSFGPNWIGIAVLIVATATLIAAGARVVPGLVGLRVGSIALDEGAAGEVPPIGGWLYVVGFQMIVGPIRFVVSVLTLVSFCVSRERWEQYTLPGLATYRPWMAYALLCDAVLATSILVYHVVVSSAFFQRRRVFRTHYPALVAAMVVFVVVDVGIAMAAGGNSLELESSVREALRVMVFGGVWAAYIQRSSRVAETFVR